MTSPKGEVARGEVCGKYLPLKTFHTPLWIRDVNHLPVQRDARNVLLRTLGVDMVASSGMMVLAALAFVWLATVGNAPKPETPAAPSLALAMQHYSPSNR